MYAQCKTDSDAPPNKAAELSAPIAVADSPPIGRHARNHRLTTTRSKNA